MTQSLSEWIDQTKMALPFGKSAIASSTLAEHVPTDRKFSNSAYEPQLQQLRQREN